MKVVKSFYFYGGTYSRKPVGKRRVGFHERPLVFETKSIMAAMSVGGKSLGNLQCWKLHLSPNLQASFVSRNDAQYCCERPGGKKQFLARNVYNGASKGCLGSICFTTITRLLLLSVIIIGEADIAITSFATISPLESRLVPPRRIPLTL